MPHAWMRFTGSRASQPCVRCGLAIFLFRVFGPPATLPGSKMTMMKKKMAANLASATATLKPETRTGNMILDFYPVTKMGDTGEALKYSARMPRHLQPSAPAGVEHKKPRRKRRLRSVGLRLFSCRRESAYRPQKLSSDNLASMIKEHTTSCDLGVSTPPPLWVQGSKTQYHCGVILARGLLCFSRTRTRRRIDQPRKLV